MKKLKKILIAVLLTATVGAANAQNNPIEYNTTVDETGYYCETSKIVSPVRKDNITYITKMEMITVFNNAVSIGFTITTVGDKEVISIARKHKPGDKQYKTSATVTFNNNRQLNVKDALILDATKDNFKSSASMGCLLLYLNFPDYQSPDFNLLRNNNIQKIVIEGHTVDFNKIKVNTAAIVDQMFKEISQKGYKGSGGQQSYGATPSANKAKSALELVYYPLGILPKDGAGMTYYTALNEVKSKTNWKIEEYQHRSFFTTYAYKGYDITWHGLSFFSVKMRCDERPTWNYTIHLDKSQYTESQAVILTKTFIKEIEEGGFTTNAGIFEGESEYPVSKELTKGTYRIEVTLSNRDDNYSINVDIWPNW